MRALLRIAAALLIAVPVLVGLVVVFALAGRRRTSPPPESAVSLSLERDALAGSSHLTRGLPLEVSRSY